MIDTFALAVATLGGSLFLVYLALYLLAHIFEVMGDGTIFLLLFAFVVGGALVVQGHILLFERLFGL